MPNDPKPRSKVEAPPYLYDVFLSHHSSDKPLVEIIAARLEDEAGLKPFLDKWHLVLGNPWAEELEAALDKSATCAVFLGPSGIGAWHNEEMRAALDERAHNKSFRVVPILLPEAKPEDKQTLPRFLCRLSWVDFRAGLDDQEAFHRLVAGIKGVPPGRQPASLNSAPSPAQALNQKAKKRGLELWKIVVGSALALLLSASLISAAIPRYKLRIKWPGVKQDNVYKVPAGMVTIQWVLSKEQWFREFEISDAQANITIKKAGDEKEDRFEGLPGEMMKKLEPGQYVVRIDAVEHQRSETIALEIAAPLAVVNDSNSYFRGSVEAKNGEPVGGAEVELTEILGQPVLKTITTDDGGFNISNIPAKLGERVRVTVRVKGVEKYNLYWTLPGPARISLEK